MRTELFVGCPKSSPHCLQGPGEEFRHQRSPSSLADLHAGCVIPEQLSEGREEVERGWGDKSVIWISLQGLAMCVHPQPLFLTVLLWINTTSFTYRCLLCTKHFFKDFSCFISFNPLDQLSDVSLTPQPVSILIMSIFRGISYPKITQVVK